MLRLRLRLQLNSEISCPRSPIGRGKAFKPSYVWVRISLGVSTKRLSFSLHAHVPQSGRGTRLRTVTVRVRLPSWVRSRTPTGRGTWLRTMKVRVRISSRVRHSGAIGRRSALKMRDLRVQVLPVLLETWARIFY